ncbi:SLAM family member 9-like [Leptodactylus fuscus]|uniref:SLAM family member 9-like n=1 Tax=Leptodactylus fuscus TaxID=238119 RepID=UPI003F4EF96A
MKMGLSLLLPLVFLLQPCVITGDSCSQRNVSGAAGGEVILRVPQEWKTSIDWLLLQGTTRIVTTKPGGYIDDEEVIEQYKGRVRSEADGSLHISNLSQEDQRIYKADIRRAEDTCVHFNLTIYERLCPGDLRITGTITRNDTCSPALLCTVDKPDVTITWRNINSSDVNVTGGVLYVPPSDVNLTYICTASNPVSNVSKTVIPKEYCNTGPEKRSDLHDRERILTISVIVIVIIVIIGIVYVRCFRKSVIQQKGASQSMEPPTENALTEDPETTQENPYQSPGEEQKSKTVYATVQHVKKGDNQKQEERPSHQSQDEQSKTLYSEVQYVNKVMTQNA